MSRGFVFSIFADFVLYDRLNPAQNNKVKVKKSYIRPCQGQCNIAKVLIEKVMCVRGHLNYLQIINNNN